MLRPKITDIHMHIQLTVFVYILIISNFKLGMNLPMICMPKIPLMSDSLIAALLKKPIQSKSLQRTW
jgi:hypothetical protein